MADIPLVDLQAAHRAVEAEVLEGFHRVLSTAAFVGGPDVAAFEDEYATWSGVRHCVGVGNGTDALELALRALGVGPGDEVVLPANTFVATAEAVVRAGAKPVLVDVDPEHLLMDPELLEPALTPRTRAVVPVHLYGQAAPVERVRELTDPLGVPVLEDAAQSQGATRHGVPAGKLGRVAATSFYPGKNLGAYGDAGAVLTDDEGLAAAVRLLTAHGSPARYQHPVLGFNSRLDTLQAVVLRAKLKGLTAANEARRRVAARYDRMLAAVPVVRRPQPAPGNEHVWHLYVVRVPDRDRVVAELRDQGIGAGIHYPVPVHLTGAFAGLGHGRGAFPVSEAAADEIMSLPLFPEITVEQQEAVVAAVTRAVR